MFPARLAGYLTAVVLAMAAFAVPLRASAEDAMLVAIRHTLQAVLPQPRSGAGGETFRYASFRVGRSREIVVYVEGRGICGSGGCVLFVLAQDGSSLRVIGETGVLFPPIRVLTTTSHGRPDLGVVVAGGGIMHGFEVRLRFDGRRYPDSLWGPDVPRVAPHTPGRVLLPSTFGAVDTAPEDQSWNLWPPCTGPKRSFAVVESPSSVRSPNGRWEVEIEAPSGSFDNFNLEASSAILVRCPGDGGPWPLFILLNPDVAVLAWSPDSTTLLVEHDERLRLFRVNGLTNDGSDVPERSLDGLVRRALQTRLGTRRASNGNIYVMWWQAATVVLAVSGSTTGSPSTFCYGVPIDTRTLRVGPLLSRRQLGADRPYECR